MSTSETRDRGRTAFVFAGGGSLGAIEVGMLRGLVEYGIRADLVAGSSVGAINAAFYAGRPDLEGVRALEEVWHDVHRRDVFPVTVWRSLKVMLARRGSLVDPSPLRGLLERSFAYRRLEEAPIPCVVVATDLLSGEEVTLDSGPVIDALLASAALPAVFPAVVVAGRSLADGMLVSHTPIAAAVRRGASRVIVLPTGHGCAMMHPPTGAVGSALHALNLIIARQLAADAERFADRVDLVIVPPLCPLSVSSHDFSQTSELIDRASEATRLWLKQGGLERSGIPVALRPHRHDHEREIA